MSEPMTEEQLGAIERREKAASPGPWRECGHDRGGCACGLIWSLPLDRVAVCSASHVDDESVPDFVANARFIAAARSDVPALLAEVRRLQAKAAHVDMPRIGPRDPDATLDEALLTLVELGHCASLWVPDARLLGNVRAGDIDSACHGVINEVRRLQASEAGATAAVDRLEREADELRRERDRVVRARVVINEGEPWDVVARIIQEEAWTSSND